METEETTTTTLSPITFSEQEVVEFHDRNSCFKERLLDYYRFTEWLRELATQDDKNSVREHFKKKDQAEKEERKKKMAEAIEEKRKFKDFQRRESLGLLTPEEIEQRRLKKEEKHKNYLTKKK